jgi:16S rRNA (cytidine1402-2'-O)-methyltransferase
MPPASLIVVPTPIGNLGDITLRALETLKAVDAILAEDTRTSGKLLKHFGIDKPLKSFHSFNEHQKLPLLVRDLKEGRRYALISDAGTPGISDPGFLIIRACIQEGIPVECLPGATAMIPALINSGFPTDRFLFEGFLPHKKGRKSLLEKLAAEERTIILYESPHRVAKTLEQLAENFGGDRHVSVSRELSKVFEETRRGTLEELAGYFREHDPRGEFVIVIEGRK